ncbi:MAG: heme NO-binding domain-containing protein [Crocinitomicaceae bacterium]
MKGIIFTEFIEMCEKSHGMVFTNELIIESNLESKGAYTSVGTYDHREIFQLVRNLSKKTNFSEAELFNHFAKYFFQSALNEHSDLIGNVDDPFDLLEIVDSHIHKEVLKLYPDAQLPKFNCHRTDNKLEMIYISPRKMSDFAQGLIEATLEHFETDFNLSINTSENGDTIFTIIKT